MNGWKKKKNIFSKLGLVIAKVILILKKIILSLDQSVTKKKFRSLFISLNQRDKNFNIYIMALLIQYQSLKRYFFL